jgi:hypothetical protein
MRWFKACTATVTIVVLLATALLRFPLDHLFHSDEFTLVEIKRLEPIGSDHFPILVGLRLQPSAEQQQEAPPKKQSDEQEGAEALRKNASDESEHASEK